MPKRSRRGEHIIAVAKDLTEEVGWDALTMRLLAERVGIKAPSLYKHTSNKDELRAQLTIDTLMGIGHVLWDAADDMGHYEIRDLMLSFRRQALRHPELYGLVMAGTDSCSALQAGQWRDLLVNTCQWMNIPLLSISPSRTLAYAVWSSTFGLATLEARGSLPPGSGATEIWDTVISIYEPHFASGNSKNAPNEVSGAMPMLGMVKHSDAAAVNDAAVVGRRIANDIAAPARGGTAFTVPMPSL